MGIKLLWTGLFIALLLPLLVVGDIPLQAVGVIVAAIGLVLLWLDK